jgi:hypothetical protein
MKRFNKKLVLKKETIAHLTRKELKTINGGIVIAEKNVIAFDTNGIWCDTVHCTYLHSCITVCPETKV